MSHSMIPSYAICICLLVLPTQWADADDNPLNGMDAFVSAAKKHWEVPGLSVAVVKDGKVVFVKSYGVRVVRGDAPVNENTLFDIASCTKSFTAASVAVLVDQGKLKWDDTVSKHLPTIEFPDKYMTRHASLRDLLSHRTGLARGDLLFVQGDMDRNERLRRIKFMQIESPFRTRLSYSNLMYAVIHDVVAMTAKQPWQRFVDENLFKPLEMRSTTFSIGKQQRHNFAPRHWRDEGKIISRGIPATGGIYSSIEDMAKWLQCQLALGRKGDRQILSEKAIREMHAMHHSVPMRRTPKNNPYAARFYGAGLGWFTLDYRGRKLVMHTGSWGAIVAMIPEENLGVVVLSNLDWNGMTGMLMYRILDSYCVPSKTLWRTDNFKQFDSEGPGYAYRNQIRERSKLNASRVKKTMPSIPLAKYAGHYRSSFFGDIQVIHKDGRLSLSLGRFTPELMHWENDVFYAKAPTKLNFDWLVQFGVKDGGVSEVTLKYVGWHEPDAIFRRMAERK